MKTLFLFIFILALPAWSKPIDLPLVLLPDREKTPPKVMAIFDAGSAPAYYFASSDLKTWVVQLCKPVEKFKQGLHIFDNKGLRYFPFQPKGQFEEICNNRCEGCEYKVETAKSGEVTSLQADWDMSEFSGVIKLQINGSKLVVKECVVEGHASEPPTKFQCR